MVSLTCYFVLFALACRSPDCLLFCFVIRSGELLAVKRIFIFSANRRNFLSFLLERPHC